MGARSQRYIKFGVVSASQRLAAFSGVLARSVPFHKCSRLRLHVVNLPLNTLTLDGDPSLPSLKPADPRI
jgi:hypothetical protein